MLELIRALSPLRMGTVCDGLDQCVEVLKQELGFEVHEFASGTECNGWIVPMKWECQRAVISDRNGMLIYDGNAHPLGVASYSNRYQGPVNGTTLKEHLFYCDKPGFEDELIYHCDWWYKPHARSWGLCVPKRFFDTIVDNGTYVVDIRTTFEPGTMKVCEYVLPGESEESIVLNAHNCHPWCANDDLSGIAVGIAVMRALYLRNNRYTYRLIVAPEHYGSIFYLNRFGSLHLRCALFLESLGTTGPLALQTSFHGDDEIDVALRNALRGITHHVGEFRSIVGNDETCWDSAGHCVPCPSLSRVPFPEYHTSRDCPDLMSENSLNQAVDVVSEALWSIDNDHSMKRKFTGLVCLSNPRYDLYQPYFDPSIPDRRTVTEDQLRWNRLMNHLPRHFDKGETLLELSERFGVKFERLYHYVKQWEDRGLIDLYPC